MLRKLHGNDCRATGIHLWTVLSRCGAVDVRSTLGLVGSLDVVGLLDSLDSLDSLDFFFPPPLDSWVWGLQAWPLRPQSAPSSGNDRAVEGNVPRWAVAAGVAQSQGRRT